MAPLKLYNQRKRSFFADDFDIQFNFLRQAVSSVKVRSI